MIGYIQQWRNPSLNCNDQLSKVSTIEMCIQGMHWGLGYILQGKKPRTFEEFPIRTHDMELSIASNGHQGLPVHEKQNCHKGGKFPFKAENKQSLIITTAPFKVPFK